MAKKGRFNHKNNTLQERRHGFKETNPRPIIIVTEGEKTEPIYFKGIVDYISSQNPNTCKKPKIKIVGVGKGSSRLVDEALSITSRNIPLNQECWIVFDKDDNPDFEEAIAYAKKCGFNVAWSNESFECWLYMHFKQASAAWRRSDYEKRLDGEFKASGLSVVGYEKTNPAIGALPVTDDYLKKAVQHAQRLEAKNAEENRPPSKCNPGTTVHHLILALKPYIKELL